MTFVGFHIDRDGNLLNPDTRQIIERNLMTRQLRTGLHVQRVDMETNYESWSKYVLHKVALRIMTLCDPSVSLWPYSEVTKWLYDWGNFHRRKTWAPELFVIRCAEQW